MDNSKEYIRQLLEKYWSCESTLEEEQTLVSYFKQPAVDKEFETFKPLFNYFDEQRRVSIDLEDQIMSRIAQTERKGKVIHMPWRRVISVAAAFLLLLVVPIAISQYRQHTTKALAITDTYQTPEEALEQTKAALLYLSEE